MFNYNNLNIMKRSILVLAIAGFFSFASLATEKVNNDDHPHKKNKTEMVDKKDGEFKEVSVINLPDAVKKAAKQNNNNVSIESAEEKVLTNGEKIYRIKLESDDELLSETKTFYSDGKEFAEEASEDESR
jgi:MFS superfamily sulfate permease-like transporter